MSKYNNVLNWLGVLIISGLLVYAIWASLPSCEVDIDKAITSGGLTIE